MSRISACAIDRANYSAASFTTETDTAASTTVLNRPFSLDFDYSDEDGSFSSPSKDKSDEEQQEKHGLLHTIEVIERGTRFALEVILDSSCDRFIDNITSLITKGVEDEGFGGSKSRGFGEVSVQNVKIEEITTELVEKRSESIGKNLRFSLYLVSPMVIENTYRSIEPSALLEGARRAYSWCFKEGKPSLPDLVRLKQIFSYEVFGGWSLKEDKQRRSAVSVSSGSSFLFECLPSSNQHTALLLAKGLSSLEYYALGGYKPHGYGQIKIV